MRKCRHVKVACGCGEEGNEGASLGVPLWGWRLLDSLQECQRFYVTRFQAEIALAFRCLHYHVVETLFMNISIIRPFLSIQGLSSSTPMDVSRLPQVRSPGRDQAPR